jgi:putative sigma-54 modulation protein
MNIVVKGKHLRENQALEDFAFKKTAKFYHFFPDITKIEVAMRSETGHKGKETDFVVDIIVRIPGKTHKVQDAERDMYKAVDQAVDRMSEVLRREKEKKKNKAARSLKHFSLRGMGLLEPFRVFNKRLFRR